MLINKNNLTNTFQTIKLGISGVKYNLNKMRNQSKYHKINLKFDKLILQVEYKFRLKRMRRKSKNHKMVNKMIG